MPVFANKLKTGFLMWESIRSKPFMCVQLIKKTLTILITNNKMKMFMVNYI
jgi:hypothetical protein